MIIVTKSAKKLEKKYYKCICPRCGTEFVFDETELVKPLFLHTKTYIHCPNSKCYKIIYDSECWPISESQFEDYLLPHKTTSLRPNTSNPDVKNTI